MFSTTKYFCDMEEGIGTVVFGAGVDNNIVIFGRNFV